MTNAAPAAWKNNGLMKMLKKARAASSSTRLSFGDIPAGALMTVL